MARPKHGMGTPPPPGWYIDQVLLLHRHGHRSPALHVFGTSFPFHGPRGEPLCHGSALSRLGALDGGYLIRYDDRDRDDGHCGRMQLTDRGAAAMEELGRRLRVHYGDALPATADPAAVRIRSTEITRAVLSAASLVRGLYPSAFEASAAANAPLRINVREERSEYIYPNYRTCARFASLMRAAVRAERDTSESEVAQVRAELAALLPPNDAAARRRVERADVHTLWDAVECARAHGAPVPAVSDALMTRLRRLAAREVWGPFRWDRPLSILGTAPLINAIADDIESRARGGPLRLSVYSGHDSSIVAFLASMSVKEEEHDWPPFASVVAVEVMRRVPAGNNSANVEEIAAAAAAERAAAVTAAPPPPPRFARHLPRGLPAAAKHAAATTVYGDAFVRLVHDGRPVVLADCAADAPPGSPEFCPLASFMRIAREIVPADWDAACQRDR